MTFRIVTTASSDYRFVLDRCLPSWYRHSGASRLDVHLHDTAGGWAANVIKRCEAMRRAVHEAAGERLLFLDADCLVLGDLSSGFSDDKPISVARWPNINLGVLFLNMTLDWPFAEFFDKFAERGIAYCTEHPRSQGLDQNVMTVMLGIIEHRVHKLDNAIWNWQVRADTTREQVDEHRATGKILHLVGMGGGAKREAEWKEIMDRVL